MGSIGPETAKQAGTWQTVKGHYLRDGFCHRCAAQAAWGHQCGFGVVEPVCDRCRGIRPTHRSAGVRANRWTARERPED